MIEYLMAKDKKKEDEVEPEKQNLIATMDALKTHMQTHVHSSTSCRKGSLSIVSGAFGKK